MENCNQLASASSPYLLQHAHNPVHWQEWSDAILEEAKQQNKPLLISIGYAACHWCHVMEDESFMDQEVADLMNRHFICIKVDREERPDIDQVYMNTIHLLGQQGGWPLNAFAMPDGKPFYVVTYLPRSQWIYLLEQLASLYAHDHNRVLEQADALTRGLRSTGINIRSENKRIPFSREEYDRVGRKLLEQADFKEGGLQGAPKFPMPSVWEFVLQYAYFSGNQQAAEALEITLENMACGGIFDQVAGGFARYSVDAQWFIPHFEKMLYDNAQLISLYAQAYKRSGKEIYREVVVKTFEFIRDALADGNGAYYSSLNADSEGEEGKYYVWSFDELEDLLDDDELNAISRYWGLIPGGNWENGMNLPVKKCTDSEMASELGISIDDWKILFEGIRGKMLQQRKLRIPPTTDDKVLTSWNALMCKAALDAYQAFGDESFLQAGLNCANFLLKRMRNRDGSLFRNFRQGKASVGGFLEDYALLAETLIVLYETTFRKEFLDRACECVYYIGQHFADRHSPLYFFSSDHDARLVARTMEISDNVIPAGNSILAHVFFKLGHLLNNSTFTGKAENMWNFVSDQASSHPAYFGKWLQLGGFILHGHHEIAVTGTSTNEALRQLQRQYLPGSIFLGGSSADLPLLKGKNFTRHHTVYVCRNQSCEAPSSNTNDVINRLIRKHEE